MNHPRLIAFFVGVALLPSVFSAFPALAQQSEIKQLQNQIEDRNDRLSEIDKEIAKFELQLMEVGAEKKTLQSAINRLEAERGKVNAEINKTENMISSTDLEINKLILEMKRTEQAIVQTEAAIGEVIRTEFRQAENSLLELLLRHDKLSQVWSTVEAHENIREVMAAKVAELGTYKALLAVQRGDNEERREELADLRDQYEEQGEVLVHNKAEQSQLLTATKNEEATYQTLLEEQQAAREQLERELRDFESKLQFFLDPTTIPAKGTAVFNWPIANPRITQLFGGTEFAANNPGIYGRPYHPGVDFGAPVGTPILAPLSGTVRAIGNTDIVPGCQSWGQWTLIDHANGLSSLYAHQSVIGVSPGQKVSTGEIIGYVGDTGLAFGAHLHFTVYAKDGVSVRKFNEIKTITSCGPASTPTAAPDAYIDPMLYLPA